MPNPKTYGELRDAVDRLIEQIDRIRGNLDRKRAGLESLKGHIAAEADETELGGGFAREVASIDRDSAAYAAIVNPEEIWNC